MNLYFDIRDIFRSPRLALSGKKIWIFLRANISGYLVYFIFNYLGLMLMGQSIKYIWATQGLYPCLYLFELTWYSALLFWISIIYWLINLLFAATGVSRVTYKQLKGDEFYSAKESREYVKRHWHAIIFSPVSIFLIVLFFIILAIIFSFISKIPYLGEFLFALPYLIYFFGSLFTIYTIGVFIISIIYTPAIVGSLEEDTMGSTFNSYAIAWGQPWRVICYNIILIPLTYVAHTIFGYATFLGFKFINLIFGHDILMGSKLNNIVGTAANVVWPKNLGVSIHGSDYLNFHNFFIPTSSDTLTGIECISSLIVGFFLLLITISWLSYTLSTLTVGHTLMLCIFKKRSDNVNILEKKDEEEEFENNILETKNDLLIEADDQLNKNNQNDSEDLDNTEE